jgi:hypothetical protein
MKFQYNMPAKSVRTPSKQNSAKVQKASSASSSRSDMLASNSMHVPSRSVTHLFPHPVEYVGQEFDDQAHLLLFLRRRMLWYDWDERINIVKDDHRRSMHQ